jgi:hypothetical protein
LTKFLSMIRNQMRLERRKGVTDPHSDNKPDVTTGAGVIEMSTPDLESHAPPHEAQDPDFDEEWYLGRYPAVAAAVTEGKFPSGLAHYRTHGRSEGRSPKPPVQAGTDR